MTAPRAPGRTAASRAALRSRVNPSHFHPDLRLAATVLPDRTFSPALLPLVRRLISFTGDRDTEVVRVTGDVPVRVHRPEPGPSPRPGLLWVHGGGYVMGAARQNDTLCRHLATELGAVVAAVDYRLAPENPYPAALNDCYAALQWLGDQPDVDADRIVVAGSSAGGGLTAALAFAARDRGGVQPVLQVLSYPMLDDRSIGDDLRNSDFRLWSVTCNRFGWKAYLGDADPTVAVPARREDLTGLAPAWIGVGTLDLFHTEDLAYAERLREAGVPCEVLEVPGAFHGFDEILPKAGVSRDYLAALCAAVRAVFDA
ncbi:alpha/beta hydrolase [Nocardia barduliensis]|uniref:alpha/beta hydrolase n=1 Tax=Nocardia barduliensis TaxID=2736643 RepID=UPI001573CBB6|nr:alpha/beta hydrolase [Nocardia barduliensis]